MPQVPVYQERQVRTAPLQPVLQQTPDVSSGARALAQGLGQVAEVADRMDLRDAQAKASTAESTITSEWLKWDSANRNKYRGANADGYAPAAEAWWKSAAETAGKDLDPRSKLLASQNLRAKQTAAMGNVLTFTGAEKERHADETYAADVNTTIQFGVTSGDVASTATQIRDKAAVLGARKGWTTEQVQAEAGKNLSSMHLAQISKLAEMDAAKAQKYYDENKAEVGFQNQARVEQVLKGELDNQFATQEAARLAALPLKEQLAEAAKIADPQRREKTLMQMRNNYALVKQAEAEQEAQFSNQAWQNFATGQKTPEAILSAMSGRERVQLQEAQRARSERMAAGTPVKTDFNTWYVLNDKISRGEKVDLRAYTEKVSGDDLKGLANRQQTAGKPGGQEGLFNKQQRVDGMFLELTGKAAKDDPARAYTFEKAVDARMLAESTSKNRVLTPTEEAAIVENVAKDAVYVKGFWGSDQMPAALVPAEDLASTFVVVPVVDANGQPKLGRNNVPLTKRQPLAEIPSWFRARAMKSGARTEQQIAEDYAAAKAKGLVK
jgi:PIN domain nuclease of toxin-antitoxin system